MYETMTMPTRTLHFAKIYTDKMCPLGCGQVDNLKNILTCTVIKQHHNSKEITDSNIIFEDIFSKNVAKQQKVTELYSQLLETRSRILQSIPVTDITGPAHGTLAVQRLPILSS